MSEVKSHQCRIVRHAHEYQRESVALVYCAKCNGVHVFHAGRYVRTDPGIHRVARRSQEGQA